MLDLDELERIGKAAGDREWCAVIPPEGVDRSDYRYGYGEIRTRPDIGTETGCGGWSIVVKVDDHDEQDGALRFIEAAKNNWQALIDRIRELERRVARQDHNARSVLQRWGNPEAESCIDPVFAVCVLAGNPECHYVGSARVPQRSSTGENQ
jgi:hypothetical protein